MKNILGAIFAILLTAMATVSFAATGNFAWTISSTNADSTPANVAGTVTKIYFSTTSPVTTTGTLIFTSTVGVTSATAVNVAGAVACGTNYYFATTSTADGQTGAISDTVSSSYACGVPGKPTLSPVILFK